MKHASQRIDVGGKLLTNLFCEMISTKDFNMQGEFMIVNDIKEKTCYMAEDSIKNDMERGREIKKEYLLPDYNKIHRGKLLDRS